MSENHNRDAAGDFIDRLSTYLRGKIDVLSQFDISMEDFLFLDSMIVDDDQMLGLSRTWNIVFGNPAGLEISNENERRAFLLGAAIGYSQGLKDWISDSEDEFNIGP